MFAEGTIYILCASALLRRVGASGLNVENDGWPMKVFEYPEGFASCGIWKLYAHEAWKTFDDIGEGLTH